MAYHSEKMDDDHFISRPNASDCTTRKDDNMFTSITVEEVFYYSRLI